MGQELTDTYASSVGSPSFSKVGTTTVNKESSSGARVLQLGILQDNIVVPLVRHLEERLPLETVFLKLKAQGKDSPKSRIDSAKVICSDPRASISHPTIIRTIKDLALARVPRARREWFADFCCRAIGGQSISKSLRFASQRLVNATSLVSQLKDRGHQDFDICHLHGIWTKDFYQLHAVSANAKLLVSIWGSDLLRSKGLADYRLQSRVLDRSDMITVHSSTMKEIMLAKFGRHLEPKIRQALLGSCMLDEIDKISSEQARVAIREKYSVPANSTLLVVGRNGDEANQHLAILEQLARVDTQDLFVLIPVGYGLRHPYRAKLERAVNGFPGEARLITEFLSDSELAILRKGIDIQIELPVSDALGASVMEVLYAGNILVAGSWLPYKRFRTLDIHPRTIDHISQLPETIRAVTLNLESEKAAIASSGHRIREISAWENVIDSWIGIYNELLGR